MNAVLIILTSLQAASTPAQTPGTPEYVSAASTVCQRLGLTPPSADPAVLHTLGSCFFEGHGRPRDLVRARALYRQASDAGLAQAQCALGNMLINGVGGPRDVPAGLALCRRAAEAGNAHAQADLGSHYLVGIAVPKDAVGARRWLTAAAEQGHANAALTLGQIYWNGDGVPKDNAQAARWWRVAHRGGRRDAAAMLGDEAFVRVFRVARPQDLELAVVDEALRWYDLAGANDPSPQARRTTGERSAHLRRVRAAFLREGAR